MHLQKKKHKKHILKETESLSINSTLQQNQNLSHAFTNKIKTQAMH
jgi:hypothetical protein